MEQREIVIDESGRIQYLKHEGESALIDGGTSTTRRASRIHPRRLSLRVAFYALRLFGDEGPLAAWTRVWRCDWMIDLALSGGPIDGPYRSRAEAIAVEEKFVLEAML